MSAHSEDPVLDTLVIPLLDGTIALPHDSKALFLRARWGTALQDVSGDRFVCVQSFKPAHALLKTMGFETADSEGADYALTLVLPVRQRDEYRALLARAVVATRKGGVVVACVSNLEGAKTVENDLKALTGSVTSLSKHKCRVFWAHIDPARTDKALIEQWIVNDAPREVEGGYLSRPGLFAWDRLDAGSQLLLKHLPVGLAGRGADLGAGFGYLSHVALTKYPEISHIDLYEAEGRALEIAHENLKDFKDRAGFIWGDVLADLGMDYDFIISNPPFHIDRADRHDLGQGFIAAAARALKPGGQLLMVANRHLPYEDALKRAFKTVAVLKDDGAYKVFKAIKAPKTTSTSGKNK